MSLKAFHLVFCIVVGAFLVGFGGWCIDQFQASGSLLILLTGLGSIVLGILTPLYLRWFLRKLAGVGFVVALLASPTLAWACPVCLGNSNHPMVKSMNNGVVFLMVVTTMVLIPFIVMIVTLAIRSRRLAHLSI